MYLLLPVLATWQSWLLWRWGRPARQSYALPAGYILVAAAGLYTHYFYPLLLLVHNFIALYWLYQRREQFRHRAVQWVGMMLAALLLYAPWLSIFWRQAGGRSGDPAPLRGYLGEVAEFLFLGIGNESNLWLVIGPALLLSLAAIWSLRRRWLLLASLGLLPLLLAWLVGATAPEFHKFTLLSLPPLLVMAGAGFAALWQNRLLGLLSLPLLLLWAVGSSSALDNQFHDPAYARADYRSMSARIIAEGHPNAAIVLNAANQWEVFTYYFSDASRVLPLPRGAMSRGQIEAELAALLAEKARIYALFWGEAGRDPERRVERFLDENSFKAVDQWYGDVRFVMYAVPPAPEEALLEEVILPTSGLLFGGKISLIGAALQTAGLGPGEILPIQLFWQLEQPVEQRYKIFLHLVDAQGQLVAQRDSEPGGGLSLTSSWQVGEPVPDNHGLFLPMDLPPGRYGLRLGLYELTNPTKRLPLADGAEWWEMATIEVGTTR